MESSYPTIIRIMPEVGRVIISIVSEKIGPMGEAVMILPSPVIPTMMPRTTPRKAGFLHISLSIAPRVGFWPVAFFKSVR